MNLGHPAVKGEPTMGRARRQEGSIVFETYENRHNPHVTIHGEGCTQPRKRGGDHKFDQGEYRQHATLLEAERYAQGLGLPVIRCSFCQRAGRLAAAS